MSDLFWADVLLYIHFAFVLGVILPVPLTLAGRAFNWRWVRNAWFRLTHLAMIGVVAGQAALGAICPLTVWESELRRRAGQEGYERSFISHWVSEWLYYDVELWVLAIVYVLFLAVVIALFWLVPIEWKRNAERSEPGSPA